MRCSNVYERFVSTRQKIPRSSDNTCPLLSLPRLRTRAWKSRIVDLERPCFHTVLVTRSRPMNISTLHTVHTPCNTRIPRVFVSSIVVPPLIVAIDLFSRSKSIDRTKDDVERRILFFFDLLSRLSKGTEMGESPRTIVPVAVEWLLLLFKDVVSRYDTRNRKFKIVFS